MNQIKAGKFIAEKRKEKSLTQQQLGDLIGVSNKTVSKWECGNGMPEISLMLPLCDALGITVNELLSGETLESSYKEKAEENLIGLIREKETEKIGGKKIILWQSLSLIFSVAIWFFLFADSNIYQLGHVPSPLTLCYLILGFISIFAVIMISGYAVIKKKSALIFAALSFASLVCLLICIGYGTFWLMLPAAVGIALCFALSLRGMFKNRKNG